MDEKKNEEKLVNKLQIAIQERRKQLHKNDSQSDSESHKNSEWSDD